MAIATRSSLDSGAFVLVGVRMNAFRVAQGCIVPFFGEKVCTKP